MGRPQTRVWANCPTCDKEYWYHQSRPVKHCSMECRKKASGALLTKVCPGCGNEFTCYRCWPKDYCSAMCRIADKNVTTNCPVCGKEFTYQKCWPCVTCSRACAAVLRVGRFTSDTPSWKHAACEQCGNPYKATIQTRGRFCSLKCWGRWYSANRVGDKHPAYRGGCEPYYGPSWRAARRAARQRDTVCQDCGKTPEENGKALDVHHIVAFRKFGRKHHREANDLTNLKCYCISCHKKHEYTDNPD